MIFSPRSVRRGRTYIVKGNSVGQPTATQPGVLAAWQAGCSSLQPRRAAEARRQTSQPRNPLPARRAAVVRPIHEREGCGRRAEKELGFMGNERGGARRTVALAFVATAGPCGRTDQCSLDVEMAECTALPRIAPREHCERPGAADSVLRNREATDQSRIYRADFRKSTFF